MRDKILFTMPIYLRNEESYDHERMKFRNKEKEEYETRFPGKKYSDDWGWWPPWEFNDIIGYIQIYESEGMIQVHRLFETSGNRIFKKPRIRRNPIIRRRKIIVEDPEGTPRDFPSILIHKNANLKQEIADLLHNLKKITESERYFLDIDHSLEILECLDIDKLINVK